MTKQELHDLINSWENLELVLHEAILQPDCLNLLFDIALHGNHPKSWRAAWLAEKINDRNPELVKPFIGEIIAQLKKENSSGKKRHFLKLLTLHELPEEQYSSLFDYCMLCFTSAAEPVAVRVHAMQVLYNISEKEPDLKPELLSVIQHENELHSSAGIHSRGKMLAKKLHLEILKSGSHFI
jgi:hypothetical protein